MRSFLVTLGVCTALALVIGCGKSAPPKPPATTPAPPAPPAAKSEEAKPAEPPAEKAAETPAAGASIGSPGPAWENLTGTDDKHHSLKDLADAKAVAVIFTCNDCPVAIEYEDRLVKLAADYQDKGVEVVAINVKTGDSEQLPAMKERAAAKGFNFAYVSDPSQAIGKAYGATVTPHVFVLDQSRKVAYIGAIDDNADESKVTKHSLRDALDAVVAGQEPAVATTKQFGCGISYQ